MIIGKDFWFSMGHTLHEHQGKCANLHGHNYKLQVVVESDSLIQLQMVMDFSDLKEIVRGVIDDHYDHRFLIAEFDPRAETLKQIDSTVVVVPYNPTAEMVAQAIKTSIGVNLHTARLFKIVLWETESSYAEV